LENPRQRSRSLTVELRRELLAVYLEHATLLLDQNQAIFDEPCRELLVKGREDLEALKVDQPKNRELWHEEARLEGLVGVLHLRCGQVKQALCSLRQAQQDLLRVLEFDPSHVAALADLDKVKTILATIDPSAVSN
jgi:hypothetical protein